MKTYDETNIFARILRQEVPAKKIFEDQHVLAFHDVAPQAPVHVLLIPKGNYISAHHFYENASSDEIIGFSKALSHVIMLLNIQEIGYRLLSNCGADGGQEVPHYHIHILGGKPLGPMLTSP